MIDGELIQRLVREPEAVFSEFLHHCTPVLLRMIRRHIRDQDEAMEAYTTVCERFRANDYAALRRFRSGSEVGPWLSVVVANACKDRFRKQRASSVPASVLTQLDELERHVFKYFYHDALRQVEICELIASRHRIACTELDVARAIEKIDGLLSNRKRWILLAALTHNRAVLSLDDLLETSPHLLDPSADAEERLGTSEQCEALNRALQALSGEDQLLVLLRFEHGMTAVQIARMLHFENPKQVYTRLTTVLSRMRRLLEQEGVHPG